MAEQIIARTLAFPELEAREPDLPFRFWSRDEDGFIGIHKYLGGSRMTLGSVRADRSLNRERCPFELVVDSQPLRAALRQAGRTLVIVGKWWLNPESGEWERAPWGFTGRLVSGRMESGTLSGEAESYPYERPPQVQYWTHEYQQLLFPGDLAFAQASGWVEKNTRKEGFPTGQIVRTYTNQRLLPPPSAANTPPTIARPLDTAVVRGRPISPISIRVTDPDAADTVTVDLTGLPPGLIFDPANNQVGGTIPLTVELGTFLVTIAASDGVSQSTSTFNINVVEGVGAPIITNPGNFEFEQGETITAIPLVVRDPNELSVTVEVAGLPGGLSYSARTREITGSIGATEALGRSTVTVTATNTRGGRSSTSFIVEVVVAADDLPPVIYPEPIMLDANGNVPAGTTIRVTDSPRSAAAPTAADD